MLSKFVAARGGQAVTEEALAFQDCLPVSAKAQTLQPRHALPARRKQRDHRIKAEFTEA